MRVQLTRGVWVHGRAYRAGEVVDLDDSTAMALVRMQKAVPAPSPTEAAVVEASERAVRPRPRPKTAPLGDSGAKTSQAEADLADLLGERAAQALIQAGIRSIMQARLAIQAGEDLTAIKGVGPATVRKLRAEVG